jgi:hypothetical protein
MPEFIKQLHRVGFGWIFPKMSGKGIATAFIDYLKKIVKKNFRGDFTGSGSWKQKSQKIVSKIRLQTRGLSIYA